MQPEALDSVVDENTTATAVDPDMLALLGDDPSKLPVSTVDLHPDIISRWNFILSSGLATDVKTQLLQKYPRGGSCNLEAPILNPEVVATLPEAAVKRDLHFKSVQETTGSALAALGLVISTLLNEGEEGVDRFLLMEHLADAGKLLTDVQHAQSLARRAFISPGLNKDLRQVLENSKVEQLLFGKDLQDRIKDAKSMDRVGKELKAAPKQQQPKGRSGSLNWKRPPMREFQYQGGPKERNGKTQVARRASAPASRIQGRTQNFQTPRSQEYRRQRR